MTTLPVTADTVVVGINPEDIPVETFLRVQREAGSPATDSAAEAYERISVLQVSIAFQLAIFHHESQYATDPDAIVVKYDTHNPGNCRSSRTGDYPIVSTPRGPFVDYPTWVDGWLDLSFRLRDPTYVYAQEGRTTIKQIIERFAPATDNNVPSSYIAVVVADMNRWIASETMGHEMPSAINGIPVRKSFIPATNTNRPGTPANAEGRKWITVHETANPSVGANAEMHRKYTHAGGGAAPPDNDGVSFTFVVDDHEIVWLLPLEEKSWQASDGANGTGNSSASIETCVNADGDWNRTQENLAQLVAYLATNVPGRSVERIAQHNKWARDQKNCPTRLRANGGAGWNQLMRRVLEIATTGAAPPPDVLFLPDNPFGRVPVVAGFKAYVESLGACRFPADVNAGIVSIFGYPMDEEHRTSFGSIQAFERATLLWHEGATVPWDIVLERLEDD